MTWQNPYNQMQRNIEGHHVGTWQTRYPQSHGRGVGFPQRHGTGSSGQELSNNPHTGRSIIVGAAPGGFMASPRDFAPAHAAEATHANLEERLISMAQPGYQLRLRDIFGGNLRGLNITIFMMALRDPRNLARFDASPADWRRAGFGGWPDWAQKLSQHICDCYKNGYDGGGGYAVPPSVPSAPGGGGSSYKTRRADLNG